MSEQLFLSGEKVTLAESEIPPGITAGQKVIINLPDEVPGASPQSVWRISDVTESVVLMPLQLPHTGDGRAPSPPAVRCLTPAGAKALKQEEEHPAHAKWRLER